MGKAIRINCYHRMDYILKYRYSFHRIWVNFKQFSTSMHFIFLLKINFFLKILYLENIKQIVFRIVKAVYTAGSILSGR